MFYYIAQEDVEVAYLNKDIFAITIKLIEKAKVEQKYKDILAHELVKHLRVQQQYRLIQKLDYIR